MKRDGQRISFRWGRLATSGVIHFGIEHPKTLLDNPAVAPGVEQLYRWFNFVIAGMA
jgi:hypothetical protein